MFSNNGTPIELARNVEMLNDVKKAKDMKFPEEFQLIENMTDEFGPVIETVRTPPGQLKVVKKKRGSSLDSDSSSNFSEDFTPFDNSPSHGQKSFDNSL